MWLESENSQKWHIATLFWVLWLFSDKKKQEFCNLQQTIQEITIGITNIIINYHKCFSKKLNKHFKKNKHSVFIERREEFSLI